MDKFVAKLTGESDGHVVSHEFGDLPSAVAWLRGAGLAEFEDQTARGEVLSQNGGIVWTKSHLQTPECAERDSKLDGHRLLARLGLPFNRKR